VFKVQSQSWKARLVAFAIVAITLAGCGTGAPSVNHPTVAPSTGNGAIDAPANSTQASSTANMAGMGNAEPTGAAQVLPPTAATSPTPTPVNVSVGGDTATVQVSDTPTATPEETPATEPTERPNPPDPTDPGVSDVYDTGDSGRPEIALTFDGGADRGFAEQILDTLEQYGITASFGITGQWATANPDLVERMYEDGYQLFNHTWSHESFTGESTGEGTGITDPDDRASELSETNDAIAEITGGYDTRPYWRPPYGDYDESVLEDVAADGYTVTVRWSCDTLGWNGATVDEILDRCTTDQPDGAIILMHVGNGSLDYEALPQMIESLQDQGFTFVTIEQLLQP
jgi:peptidoglycan/xylan/chitin deacetylase (PgdA/CDA1 family)